MSKRGPVESLASLSRTTRPITRRNKSDNLSCSWCSRDISPDADHVVLSPCQCTVCPKCLLFELAPRGNSEAQCHCCSSPICSHQYFESRLAQLPKAEYQKPTAEPQIDDKTWLQQPMKCLTLSYVKQKQLTPDKPFECTVLYGVRIVNEGGGNSKFDLQKCVVPFTFVGSNQQTNRAMCDQMHEFGVFLHQIVTIRSATPYSEAESLSPQRFVAKKLDNPTLLLSLCFGMATGTVMDSDAIRQPITDPINQTLSDKAKASKVQSQFLAIAGAEGMLLRSISNYPCEFQLMVNRVMQMEQMSRSAKDFLSITRIGASRALTQANLCRSVVEALSVEVHVPWNGFHFLIVDNIGFKDIANHDPENIGTLQCTQMIDVIIHPKELIAAGILSPEGKLLLSATPANTHANLQREEGAAVRLTAVSKEAKAILTECVAESIMTAIADSLHNKFEVGCTRLRSARFISFETKGILLRNTPLAGMYAEDVEAYIQATEPSTNQDHHQYFYQPNMKAQIVKRDLARTTTIKAILNYMVAVQNKARLEYEASVRREATEGRISEEEEPTDTEMEESGESRMSEQDEPTEDQDEPNSPPLMSVAGSYVVADGQPTTQFDRLLNQDASAGANRRYRNVHCFMGGFHTILKLHNAIGKLFDYIFKYYFGTYRRTLARIFYIQFPGDSRQIEKEFPELLQAIYGSAAKYFHAKYGRAPSAKELNEFMLERGKKYPLVALIILYSRYAEVAKTMKMSERIGPRGCMKTFIATLQFALPLFAMTHKTDYVRLISGFFKTWECASPLDKALYEKFLFTQVGPTGIPTMTDLFMEMFNRQTRADCGKRVFKGLEERLEQSNYMNAVERQEDGNIIQHLRTGGQAKKTSRSETHITTTASSPIIKMYDFIHNKARLFDTEAPPIIGHNAEDGTPVYAEEGSYAVQGNEHLNPELLYFCVAGEKRAKEYFQLYEIDQQHAVGRSEEDVSLKSLAISAGDLSKLKEMYVETKVSVTASALNKLMNKDKLVAAIKDVHFTLTFELEQDEEPELPNRLDSKKKDVLIAMLIEKRKKHYKIDKDAKAYIEEQAKKEFDADHQAELSISEVLDLDIYKLDGAVWERPRYNKPIEINE